MHDDQLLRRMLCHDTQHTLYINNRKYQARYRGQRYRNSTFAYSSLRLHFITEALSFGRQHESPRTLCSTPKQHIPAGHGKTNRNTTIKFDFALQSARARRVRNLSLPLSPHPCATIEAEESFARYAEWRRVMCSCSSDPSYQQKVLCCRHRSTAIQLHSAIAESRDCRYFGGRRGRGGINSIDSVITAFAVRQRPIKRCSISHGIDCQRT